MRRDSHLHILEGGIDVWNDFRKSRPDVRPDLRGCDLRSCRLQAEMRVEDGSLCGGQRWWKWPDLSYADMSGADLSDMCLRGVTLTDACLSGARLSRTVIDNCEMDGANLTHAWVDGAVFRATSLVGADLSHILFSGTVLADLDLTNAKGLEVCQSAWWNSIDIKTLRRNPDLPAGFLMMMAMSDKMAEGISHLVATPVFQSCFIACADEDREFALRLREDLRGRGVECFYFPEDAKWGRDLWGEIDRGIREYKRVILVCSEASLSSQPVVREVNRALAKEDETGEDVLLPARLDTFIFEGWQNSRRQDLLDKVVGDFSGDYTTSLEKMLEALQWVKKR